jgi:site-specific recombinase XerC
VPPNTRRAYEGDLHRYAAWATGAGLGGATAAPGSIVVYLRHLADAGRKVATIERALAAMCTSLVRAGSPSPWSHPLVADMRVALRRERGVRPTKKRAADDGILKAFLAQVPVGSLLGLRDRSLLTLDWGAALRASEPVALDVADVRRVPKGLVLLIRSSKTDQEARGEEVPVFYSDKPQHCPVRSLDAWLAAGGITDGAIYRALGRSGRLGTRLAAAGMTLISRRTSFPRSCPSPGYLTFRHVALRRAPEQAFRRENSDRA